MLKQTLFLAPRVQRGPLKAKISSTARQRWPVLQARAGQSSNGGSTGWAEPFSWSRTLSHCFSVPNDMLSSLATDSSVPVPRRLTLLRACFLEVRVQPPYLYSSVRASGSPSSIRLFGQPERFPSVSLGQAAGSRSLRLVVANRLTVAVALHLERAEPVNNPFPLPSAIINQNEQRAKRLFVMPAQLGDDDFFLCHLVNHPVFVIDAA